MNADSYYDPTEEDETCRICHHQPDDCTCPECVCGQIGNPECINRHMPWSQWGHFTFQPTRREMKAEIEFERLQAKAEMEIDSGKTFEAIPYAGEILVMDEEETDMKRKGSRKYTTLTYMHMRNPTDMIVDHGINYRNAQKFLERWEQVYRESPAAAYTGIATITRTRTRVEACVNGKCIMAAYFQEEKEKKEIEET